MDGGANVNLLSLKDATLWKFDLQILTSPITIHFGKDGASSTALHYIDGGVLFGRIYAIEDDAANLTWLNALTAADLEVIYAIDSVTVRRKNGRSTRSHIKALLFRPTGVNYN